MRNCWKKTLCLCLVLPNFGDILSASGHISTASEARTGCMQDKIMRRKEMDRTNVRHSWAKPVVTHEMHRPPPTCRQCLVAAPLAPTHPGPFRSSGARWPGLEPVGPRGQRPAGASQPGAARPGSSGHPLALSGAGKEKSLRVRNCLFPIGFIILSFSGRKGVVFHREDRTLSCCRILHQRFFHILA